MTSRRQLAWNAVLGTCKDMRTPDEARAVTGAVLAELVHRRVWRRQRHTLEQLRRDQLENRLAQRVALPETLRAGNADL